MPEPRIHVDFNGIQEDGRITALTRLADEPSAVEPDALVELWDEDGNTAKGRVVELGDRGQARIKVLLDTWRTEDPAPSPGLASIGHPLATLNGAWVVQFVGVGAFTFAARSLDADQTVYLIHYGAGVRAALHTFADYYKLRSVTVEEPATSDR